MPDALALLETRRSVSARNLTGPGPSAGEIEALIRIACRVPDHGKLAPWRFVLFEGSARAAAGERLAALLEARGADAERIAFTRAAFTRAPLVIAVVSKAASHPKIPEWEQILSAGAACMNLCHAAHAQGYAANWLTDWFAYDRDALDLLGLSASERIAGFVHVGTAAEPPQERPRPAYSEVVTAWGA